MPRPPGTALLTSLALLAFAANSILTRLALGRHDMDAASFTSVRLASGALVLASLVRQQTGSWTFLRAGASSWSWRSWGSWAGPLTLFAYAAPFSFAYLRIGAAAGALILFGAVQLTMIGGGLATGERPGGRTWLGLALAAAGLAWVMLPSAARPDPVGSVLMIVAGCAWGVYSLAGKRSKDALASNARSFVLAVPLALGLQLTTVSSLEVSAPGVALAAISGGVTSALGYAVWFRALRGLASTQAGILQLSVPVLAAFGAVLVLGETVTLRLVIAGAAVLSGVTLAMRMPRSRSNDR